MSRIRIPSLVDPKPRIPYGIYSEAGGGWNYLEKKTYCLEDVSAAAPGTEITLEDAGEVAIYSDYPVDITLCESGRVLTSMLEARLFGRITKIQVRRLQLHAAGRLVIYAGRPSLGADFIREDPSRAAHYGMHVVLVWASGAATRDYCVVTIPAPNAFISEAVYYHNCHLSRTAGTITRLECYETVTGTNIRLFQHWEKNPNGILIADPPVPFKVSVNHYWKVWGSVELADTDVTYQFNVVYM